MAAKPLLFEKLNAQLTKCRCYVVASGRNANHSDITLGAIQGALPTLYNMPVVAHLKKKEGGGWCVGAHDMEIAVSGDWGDLEARDLTVPFGVVPENCRPEIEAARDGGRGAFYLAVDILLWTGRYNIMDAAYSDDVYFNQSMEIVVEGGHFDGDGYYVIDAFAFSALCLLGKSADPKYDHKPCFPSCRVERAPYALRGGQFEREFAELMREVGQYQAPGGAPHAELLAKKEDGMELGKDKTGIPFSDVRDKIIQIMAGDTYRNGFGKQYERYVVLCMDEAGQTVTVLDRQNGYAACKMDFIATMAENGLVVTIDYGNKKDMALGAVEETDAVFNAAHEVEMVSKDAAAYEVAASTSNEVKTLTAKLNELAASLGAAKAEALALKKQLAIFESEKKEYERKRHRDIIDALVASRREEMGKYSGFLDYCVALDYTKPVEAVERELKEIHYNYMLGARAGGKAAFSAIESSVADGPGEEDEIARRYGAENAKYFK